MESEKKKVIALDQKEQHINSLLVSCERSFGAETVREALVKYFLSNPIMYREVVDGVNADRNLIN